MNDIDRIRKRMIACILAVNDQCPDEGQRLAMRAVVLSSAESAFNEVKRAVQRDVSSKRPGDNGE